jgi:uncharacterized protein YaeQ
MAISATIYKANLNIADMDRHYYADHALTLARHPSETDERMMVRLLAFALHAHDRLEFGRGIGTDDEPDLWQRDLTGKIELWIEVGQPDESRVRKACGLAERVVIYAYGGRIAEQWWVKAGPELARCRNLEVIALSPATTQALEALADRSMELQMLIQEGDVWLTKGETRIAIERKWLMRAER